MKKAGPMLSPPVTSFPRKITKDTKAQSSRRQEKGLCEEASPNTYRTQYSIDSLLCDLGVFVAFVLSSQFMMLTAP